jgi:hypothetical protein
LVVIVITPPLPTVKHTAVVGQLTAVYDAAATLPNWTVHVVP